MGIEGGFFFDCLAVYPMNENGTKIEISGETLDGMHMNEDAYEERNIPTLKSFRKFLITELEKVTKVIT